MNQVITGQNKGSEFYSKDKAYLLESRKWQILFLSLTLLTQNVLQKAKIDTKWTEVGSSSSKETGYLNIPSLQNCQIKHITLIRFGFQIKQWYFWPKYVLSNLWDTLIQKNYPLFFRSSNLTTLSIFLSTKFGNTLHWWMDEYVHMQNTEWYIFRKWANLLYFPSSKTKGSA